MPRVHCRPTWAAPPACFSSRRPATPATPGSSSGSRPASAPFRPGRWPARRARAQPPLRGPRSRRARGGSGTTADPLTQVTNYRLDDGEGAVIDVTQAVSYVNGERRFVVAYAVRNLSQGPVQGRASTGADLYLDGSDVGVGFLSGGPPRLVGGVNQTTGVAGGIEENTTSGFPPWSHFQESLYTALFSAIGDPTGGGFSDSSTRPRWTTAWGCSGTITTRRRPRSRPVQPPPTRSSGPSSARLRPWAKPPTSNRLRGRCSLP